MHKSIVLKMVCILLFGILLFGIFLYGLQGADSKSNPKAEDNAKLKSEAGKTPNNIVTQAPKKKKGFNIEKVYIAHSGKKYHKKGCSYLKKHTTIIDLKKARSRGYLPCARCKPPK